MNKIQLIKLKIELAIDDKHSNSIKLYNYKCTASIFKLKHYACNGGELVLLLRQINTFSILTTAA
ncbi:hypothetical protein C0J52_21931 [Blattella germanica]|nr:hypothetical protein C0J52_21931 [Blattella germanica]